MGMSVRLYVRYACTRSRTVRGRILKFGMGDEYENYEDPYFLMSIEFIIAGLLPFSFFFHFYYIVSLLKFVNKISR